LQAGVVDPGPVGAGVGLAPPHGGGSSEPVVLAAGPGVLYGDGQEPAAGPQPAGYLVEQAWLAVERHVDQRVEADDGVQGSWREADLGGVSADEGGAGDELAGAFDLDVADVDTGHLVPGGGQVPGDRDAATASDVQDLTALGEAVSQVSHPAAVVAGSGVVAAVVA